MMIYTTQGHVRRCGSAARTPQTPAQRSGQQTSQSPRTLPGRCQSQDRTLPDRNRQCSRRRCTTPHHTDTNGRTATLRRIDTVRTRRAERSERTHTHRGLSAAVHQLYLRECTCRDDAQQEREGREAVGHGLWARVLAWCRNLNLRKSSVLISALEPLPLRRSHSTCIDAAQLALYQRCCVLTRTVVQDHVMCCAVLCCAVLCGVCSRPAMH
jgi:hypothetical protein